MSRYVTKHETLSLDTVAAIKRLTDYNIGKFWQERIGPKEMSVATFYAAMRGDPTTNAYIQIIEQALLEMDREGELLNGANQGYKELEQFFRRWWPKYSEDVADNDHPLTRRARSATMDPVRDMLVALKIVDARGFLYDPTTNPRPEV